MCNLAHLGVGVDYWLIIDNGSTFGNSIPFPFWELITRTSNSSETSNEVFCPILNLYGMHLHEHDYIHKIKNTISKIEMKFCRETMQSSIHQTNLLSIPSLETHFQIPSIQ